MEGNNLSNVKVLEYYGMHNPPEGPGWKTVRCPFHEDKNASARSNGKGFICNGCGRKGDALALIMEEENIDYPSALIRYEDVTGESGIQLSTAAIRGRKRVNLSGEAWSIERDSSLFSVGTRKRSVPRKRPRLSEG